MKKIFFYGLLAISILIATPIASVFATTNSGSSTVMGYTNTATASGTYSGGTVTSYTLSNDGSCTPGTDHCTATNYYFDIFYMSYYTISGVNHYYGNAPGGLYTTANYNSIYGIKFTWTPGTGAASEVYIEGAAGYTTSGAHTNVTALVDGGIPYY